MSASLIILGTRGIPARHGGFETFAERLSLHLVSRGWSVEVFCQETDFQRSPKVWKGVQLCPILVPFSGTIATIVFDLVSVIRASRRRNALVLTLGYNTAIFNLLFRLLQVPNIINMDGIEWKRAKWSRMIRCWFWLNEIIGCVLGDHLIADHPRIAEHLGRWVPHQKISVIPYGADRIRQVDAESVDVRYYGLEPCRYALVIARPEPENSLLEIVKGFSAKPREISLVVLGTLNADRSAYHREVLRSANDRVKFIGAIYDKDVLAALRFHALVYVHGHQVGGTNPSLVEALGAGCCVLAHDNCFNRWVAGDSAMYFTGADGCSEGLDHILVQSKEEREGRRSRVLDQHQSYFLWDDVLKCYETLLYQFWAKAFLNRIAQPVD